MAFWQETCLKGLVLLATIASVLASLVLLLFGFLGNGSALTDQPFSWRMAAIVMTVVGSQIGLTVAGCGAVWRWIDRWSDEIAERRALAALHDGAGVEEARA